MSIVRMSVMLSVSLTLLAAPAMAQAPVPAPQAPAPAPQATQPSATEPLNPGAIQQNPAGASVGYNGDAMARLEQKRAELAARSALLRSRNAAIVNRLTEPVLIVPGPQTEPQTLARINEDLSVMARIIAKNLSEAGESIDPTADNAVLWDLYRTQTFYRSDGLGPHILFPSALPKPMYIGGFGAAFFLQVDFPLLAPPQAPEQTKPAEQTDPVWAQTRRSLYEPSTVPVDQAGPSSGPEPYSRERVDALQSNLVATLKHAANIRDLEATSWLLMVVQGTAQPTSAEEPSGAAWIGPYGKTVLTIRARKGDVDQYATGKLDQTQFEQRVQIVTY